MTTYRNSLRKYDGVARPGYRAEYRSPNGRFRAQYHQRQGSSYHWTLFDERAGESWRARTLADCREMVRDIVTLARAEGGAE